MKLNHYLILTASSALFLKKCMEMKCLSQEVPSDTTSTKALSVECSSQNCSWQVLPVPDIRRWGHCSSVLGQKVYTFGGFGGVCMLQANDTVSFTQNTSKVKNSRLADLSCYDCETMSPCDSLKGMASNDQLPSPRVGVSIQSYQSCTMLNSVT